ncbi:hypothetical protein [Nocardiopsis dassonvillei]|uniref:hypothetical protein n=1 Tax=Nocardiopsis dassonvillei TaxID=2014 RepID=UPI0033F05819
MKRLTKHELHSVLTEHHGEMLQDWTARFAQDNQAKAALQESASLIMNDIDLQDTGGLNSHRFLQITISDLFLEVSAHLGSEGRLVLDQVHEQLGVLLQRLKDKTLTSEHASQLTTALSGAERHLRSMIELDYCWSTGQCTQGSLDTLRKAIGMLTRQVESRLSSTSSDIAGS